MSCHDVTAGNIDIAEDCLGATVAGTVFGTVAKGVDAEIGPASVDPVALTERIELLTV